MICLNQVSQFVKRLRDFKQQEETDPSRAKPNLRYWSPLLFAFAGVCKNRC